MLSQWGLGTVELSVAHERTHVNHTSMANLVRWVRRMQRLNGAMSKLDHRDPCLRHKQDDEYESFGVTVQETRNHRCHEHHPHGTKKAGVQQDGRLLAKHQHCKRCTPHSGQNCQPYAHRPTLAVSRLNYATALLPILTLTPRGNPENRILEKK
jgi:hypothetical protein